MKLIPPIITLLLGLLSSPAYFAQKIMTMDLPDNPPPPFPTVLRRVVVFIQAVCEADDGRSITESGTGFVVGYSPSNATGKSFDYWLLIDMSPNAGMSICIHAPFCLLQ
jgi:hypothetical protein